MLTYLKIRNLAIIDTVEVEFREGFNVLTGETGAGKSIVVGALNLLLGSKFSPDIIRTGEEEASVEAIFEWPYGMAIPEEFQSQKKDELIISRKIFRSGRSRSLVNGSPVNISMLQELGRYLVHIFGQHEHQVLLNPDEHKDILDRFGRLETERNATRDAFRALKKSETDLLNAAAKLKQLEAQAVENEATIKELTKANLKASEEDELLEEREILKKAVQIREKAFEAHQLLYSKTGSVLSELSEVKKAIEFLASVNPKLIKLRENFEDALYRIEDIAFELRNVAETSQSNPQHLEMIDERLALIRRLKKKYAMSLAELIDHVHELETEAINVAEARTTVKQLERLVENKRTEYFTAARNLSQARRKAAKKLEVAIKKELRDLSMPDAVFTVAFKDLSENDINEKGLEEIEFLLSSNPGEAVRPLSRVASGGELSRIMLAIKALQTDEASAGTIIFDEVDAGIGGHTASAVGARLSRVAKYQQVLCVTHLHQVAALAEHHLSVQKFVDKGRTRIQVKVLNGEERIEELARMLGASPESESARDHLKSLIGNRVMEVTG